MKAKLLKIWLLTVFTFLGLYSFSAARYWVGGTGSWNDITHWSLESGSIGGASIPTSSDNVYIDAKSFTTTGQSISISGTVQCNDLSWSETGFSPELIGKSSAVISINGSLSITDSYIDSYLGTLLFAGSGNNSITLNNKTNANLLFNGSGSWSFLSNIFTSQNITLQSGTVTTNNNRIFAKTFIGNGTQVRSLMLGTSIVTVTGWLFGTTQNLTFEGSKAKIIVLGDWATNLQTGNLLYGTLTKSNKRGMTFTTTVAPYTCDASGKEKGQITTTISGISSLDFIGYILYQNGVAMKGSYTYLSDPDATKPFTVDQLMLDPSLGKTYVLKLVNESTNDTVQQAVSYPGIWPTPMTVSLSVVKHITCALPAYHDAQLKANPAGGSGSYSYVWGKNDINQIQTTQIGSNFGLHTNIACQVSDANYCTVTGTIVYAPYNTGYTGPYPFLYNPDSALNTPSCGSQNNGSISVKMLGGWGTRQFSLSSATDNRPFQSDSNFANLKQNETYTITAKDTNGCMISDIVKVKIKVIAEPTVYAGIDSTICADLKVLNGNATSANATVKWTSSGTGTFSNNIITSPVYTPSANDISNGTVTLTITGTGAAGCSTVTDQRTITISPLPTVTAGSDQSVCLTGLSYPLSTASVSNQSSITWSTLGNGGFNDITQIQPTYTFGTVDTTAKKATVIISVNGMAGCLARTVKDTMLFTMTVPPYVVAGSDKNICSGNTFKASSASVHYAASILWDNNGGDGTFDSKTIMQPVYTPGSTDKSKGVTLTVTGVAISPCIDKSSSVNLSFSNPPVLSAGASDKVCSSAMFSPNVTATNCTSFQWSTTGNGTFSSKTVSNPSYTPSTTDISFGTVTLSVTAIGIGGCSTDTVSSSMTHTMVKSAIANAGSDTNLCKNASLTLLSANALNFSSTQWVSSGTVGTLTTPAIINPLYKPSTTDLANGTDTLTLTAYGIAPCPDQSSSMVIKFFDLPSIELGSDSSVCSNGPYNLIRTTGVPATYSTLKWTTAGDGHFSDDTKLQPIYTPGPTDKTNNKVMLTLEATGNGGCSTLKVHDSLTVQLVDSAHINLSSLTYSICKGSTLTISGTSATNYSSLLWSTTGTGIFSALPLPTTTYTPSSADTALPAPTSLTLTLTAKGFSPCPDYPASITLNLDEQPTIFAGNDTTVCSKGPYTLATSTTTNSTNATIAWNKTGDGTFNLNSALHPVYTPGNNDQNSGKAVLYVSVHGSASCVNMIKTDSMHLTMNDPPTISIGSTMDICNTMPIDIKDVTASNYSSLKWTSVTGGTFSNDTSISPSYTPSATDLTNGTIALKLTAKAKTSCNDATATKTVNLYKPVIVDAGPQDTICYTTPTYTLSKSNVQNATSFVWNIAPGKGSFDSPTILHPTYTVNPLDIPAGFVSFNLKATGAFNCPDVSSTMVLYIDNGPQIDAGPDVSICYTGKATIAATATVKSYKSLKWTSNGDGSFDNDASLNPVYTPGPTDLSKNTVKLQLTAIGNGKCVSATDFMNVIIYPQLTVNLNPSSLSVSCFGSKDVSFNVTTPQSGTLPIVSYTWSDPKFVGSTIAGVGKGTYTCTVTDSKGCTMSSTATITEPLKITDVFNQTLFNSCFGDAKASVTITPSAGVSPYNYVWSTGAGNTTTASSLTAGYKYVTVTDQNNCSIVDSFNIPQPPQLRSNNVVVLPSCPGKVDGSITANAVGGTPGYVYLWSNGNATDSIGGLAKGTFTISITDSKNCLFDTTFVLPDRPALAISSYDITNVNCFGESSGKIIVHTVGGTKPYSFLWFTPITGIDKTDSILANIPATDPTTRPRVKITDNVGCSITGSQQTVTQPPVFSVSVGKPTSFTVQSTTEISVCFKGTEEWIQDLGFNLIAPSGVVLTLSTSPSNGSMGTTPNCNSGKDFDVCFTTKPTAVAQLDMCNIHPFATWDPNWIVNDRIHWPERPAIKGDFMPEDPWSKIYNEDPSNGGWTLEIQDCFALRSDEVVDSSIWKSASLSFTDSNTTTKKMETILFQQNGFNQLIKNPGDINSCAFTNYKIPLSLNTSCYGVCDAKGVLIPLGGVPPYHYKWSVPTIPDNINVMLCGGAYTVTASDANSCTANGAVNIIEPAKIVMHLDSIANRCFGNASGKAIATYISGGTMPLTYMWNNGSLIDTNKNLISGKYFLTTTDWNSCHQVDSIIVRDSLQVQTNITVDSTKCSYSSDGAIHLVPSGSYIDAPITYKWQTGGTNATESNLASGIYTVTVKDNDGCLLDTKAIVPSPLPIKYGATIISAPTCAGRSDASIVTGINGGTPPYSYKWSNGGSWIIDNSKISLTGIPAGSYTVTVIDKYNCTRADTTFIITDPVAMIPTIIAPDSLKCKNDANGTASVSVVNGISPYSYLWSTNSTDTLDHISGLKAGTYTVTVYDKFACSISASTTIKEPSLMVLTTSIVDSVSCTGQTDARFAVIPSGGVPSYSYLWSDAAITDTVKAEKAGIYTVTVTDKNNCSDKATLTITDPPAFVISFKGQIPSQCSTASGTASITASGGTSGYTYQWSNTLKTNSITNVFAGDYTVTATDRFGCTANTSITVKDTTSLAIKVKPIQQSVSCKGRNDGSGFVVASGTNGYIYNWSNGLKTDSLDKLLAGTYYITVTDSYTCKRIDSLVIDESNILTAVINPLKNISCSSNNNGSLTAKVSGGFASGGYSYLWNTNAVTPTISGLIAGNYSVTVSDTSNCKVLLSPTLTKEVFTAAFVNTNDVLCHNTCTGSSIFSADKSVGTKPFKYTWENGETDSLAKALCAGTTNVTVTDSKGCSYSDKVDIKDLVTSLAVTFDTAFVTVCGTSMGHANATVTGGSPAYSYKWSNGVLTNTNPGVPVGIYDLTVTDAKGCNLTSSVTIADTSKLPFAIKIVDVWCIPCSGKAIVYKTDPTDFLPYTYQWADGSTSDTLNNACIGVQTVKVMNNNNFCINVFRDTVKKAGGLDIKMHVLTPRTCVYSNDAGAYVTYKNNLAPVSYKWSTRPTDTDSSSLNLGSGTYTVTVTDGTCTLVDSITFVDPIAPVETMKASTVSCFQGSDGTASLTMLNALVPDSIIWNDNKFNPQKTPKAVNLPMGMYTATVYYNGSCIYKDSVQVNQNTKLNVSWVVTNAHCGSADGQIIATASGAVPFTNSNKYTFRWHSLGMDSIKLPQYNNDTIKGIGVDYYVLQVTDSFNCSFTSTPIQLSDNGNITLPPASNPDSVRFPTCGSPLINNGFYRIKPAGTNPPYDYSFWKYNTTATDSVGNWWKLTTKDDAKGTGSADSLSAGDYKVYVTNSASSSCKSVFLFTIGTNFLTASINKSDVTCPLKPDGWAKVTAGNGLPYLHKPKYRYIWSTGSTNDSIFGLKAGNYSVTVTDSISCPVVVPITINNPVFMTITMPDTVKTICYKDTAATVTPIITGGNAPFTYSWDGKVTGLSLVLPKFGWHQLVVNDNGCFVANDSIFIDKSGHLTMTSVDSVKIACGASNGTLALHVDGTSLPISYAWNNGSALSSITAIPVGYYSYTVTDGQGCTLTDTLKLTDVSNVTFTIIKDANVHCSGKASGKSHVINPKGGSLSYPAIAWQNESVVSNKDTNWIADSLRAGIIEVRVFDSNGCTGLDRVRIATDSVLQLKFTNIVNDVSCPASPSPTGSVLVNVLYGKPKYIYQWNPASADTSLHIGLSQRTYYITVTDSSNCQVTDSVVILKAPLQIDSVKQTNSTCFGSKDGTVQVKPLAGTGFGVGTKYAWSDGQSTATASKLDIGTYMVTVSETNNACYAVDTFVISQPQQFSISYKTLKKTICKDSIGMVEATVVGGTKPYSYAWTGMIKPDTLSITDTILNHWTDFYTIHVLDANSCPFTDKMQTNDTSLLAVQLDTFDSVSCNKLSDGLLQVKPMDGMRPYTYSWSHSALVVDSVAKNLPAGTYTVTVTDFNQCKVTYTKKIVEPDTMVISFPYPTKITCFGGTDTVVAHITGGNGKNNVSWKLGAVALAAVDTMITNATIGTYHVSVDDAKHCKADSSIVMTQAKHITFTDSVVNTGCGTFDNSGKAIITSVTSDYLPVKQIKWSNDNIGAINSNLLKGTYKVFITDSVNCVIEDSVIVLSDKFDSLSIDTVQMATCNYNSPTGILAAKPIGSIKPYSFKWNTKTGDTASTIKKLIPGSYTVTVTGGNGCTIVDSAKVRPMIDIDAVITTPNQNGEVTTINFCKNDTSVLIGSNTKRIIRYDGKLPVANERFLWSVKDGNTDSLLATMNTNTGDTIKVKPFQPTTYQLWYQLYGCKIPVREVTLTYYEPIGLHIDINKDGEILHDTTTIIKGYKIDLQPDKEPWFVAKDPLKTGFVNYSWFSFDTLMKRDGIFNGKPLIDESYYNANGKTYNIEITPDKTTWYVVIGKTSYGCYERDSVRITVKPGFTIPSGISPNGDGINDKWDLPYLKQYADARVTVFNRWGIVVWDRSKDYTTDPFVGKNKDGKELPLGTYYYLIEFNDDKGTKPRAGSLTIVR